MKIERTIILLLLIVTFSYGNANTSRLVKDSSFTQLIGGEPMARVTSTFVYDNDLLTKLEMVRKEVYRDTTTIRTIISLSHDHIGNITEFETEIYRDDSSTPDLYKSTVNQELSDSMFLEVFTQVPGRINSHYEYFDMLYQEWDASTHTWIPLQRGTTTMSNDSVVNTFEEWNREDSIWVNYNRYVSSRNGHHLTILNYRWENGWYLWRRYGQEYNERNHLVRDSIIYQTLDQSIYTSFAPQYDEEGRLTSNHGKDDRMIEEKHAIEYDDYGRAVMTYDSASSHITIRYREYASIQAPVVNRLPQSKEYASYRLQNGLFHQRLQPSQVVYDMAGRKIRNAMLGGRGLSHAVRIMEPAENAHR